MYLYNTEYDVNMQHNKLDSKFNIDVGKVFKRLRESNSKGSICRFSSEYDFDRGNLSKLERGINGCNLITAYKLSEAIGVKFSVFAEMLEEELGSEFKLLEE